MWGTGHWQYRPHCPGLRKDKWEAGAEPALGTWRGPDSHTTMNNASALAFPAPRDATN